jgi:hypothetical protein
MTNTQVTPSDELKRKIEEKRYDYFSFPILEITVKYRKPDLLKLSFNNALPAVLADTVIEAYKEGVNGVSQDDYKKKVANRSTQANNETVKELSEKGYTLLKELVVSHKILDVPQSDIDNDVISWADIPENDAIAFLMNIVNKAQAIETEGGEVSAEDIQTFPDGGRSKKRTVASKNG